VIRPIVMSFAARKNNSLEDYWSDEMKQITFLTKSVRALKAG